MIIYNIILSELSQKFLKKSDAVLRKRIFDKLEKLSFQPIGSDTKKIIGRTNIYRVRVGKYRILYSVSNQELVILVVDIDKRESVYQ